MLWIRNNPGNEPLRTWQIGDPVPNDLGPVVEFVADVEELEMILLMMRSISK